MSLPQVHLQCKTGNGVLVLKQSSFSSHGTTGIQLRPRTATFTTTIKRSKGSGLRVKTTISNQITTSKERMVSVKAIVTVKVVAGGILSDVSLTRGLDDISDLLGKTLCLELVSTEAEAKKFKSYAHKISHGLEEAKYESDFKIPASFGEVGAVLVENEHHKEMYLKTIELQGFPNSPVNIACNSWVSSKFDNPTMRVFFTNKSYLPGKTPSGLKQLREKELENIRGDGTGERQVWDRIYDYDTYNDLGDPDKDQELARPILGGAQHPYPRRCRTGRGPTKTDPSSETGSSIFYVPRDEEFSNVKGLTFSTRAVRSVLKAVLPSLETALVDSHLGFPYFTRIDALFNEGVALPPEQGDKFAWFRNEEFSRQTLAGLNPYSIQLVTEWPMRSKLDPEIYGEAESAITKEIIEREIRGVMTVDEAMKNKKLFILDYHDLFLPYVQKVREQEGTTLYASRTLFFLTEKSTLRPLAIELTRPKMGDQPQWRYVYTPAWDATNAWLWKFAKAHASAHDAGYHQLVVHWLRTHCCMEPYIIALNRQLSDMHPIYRLLHPHFRYTMEINALAREALINANGIIESCFSPGKYAIELSSVAYDQLWRFDMEAMPADLIRRGMAVEDPTAEHGVRLTIEDYPFANDGLILWDTIKSWVTDYVNHYYEDDKVVQSDTELQELWTEVRTKGHADKKDEPWWPVLNTIESLIQTLSTIIWVASGHHAAVNFGQYMYGGYFPNIPTIARTNVPNEDPTETEYNIFYSKPESVLLECLPSQIQATKVMAILDVLSTHSPDEEYIGETLEPSWSEEPAIKAAYEIFQGRLKELEGIIDARNADPNLRNRNGVGIVPYELLKPVSTPGATGMGVPNSISI